MGKYDIYNWSPEKRFFSYIKRYGLKYTLEYSFEKIFSPILHVYYNRLKRSKHFLFEDKSHNYFYHKYRSTWANERIVEIPIFKNLADKAKSEEVLEIGNVLSHYFDVKHDILDKYENLPHIIKEDILSYKPEKKYKLIISISTFEHIGWDENPRNPEKIMPVLEHIKSLLCDDGVLVFSVPTNYNPELDGMIFNNVIQLSKKIYLKRVDRKNRWVQAQENEIKNFKYGSPFFCANALLIGYIAK